MRLLDIIFGHGPGKKVFNKKEEFQKFKRAVEELRWTEPNSALFPKENLKIPFPAGELTMMGVTTIKEIHGIIENKMRIFGLNSPKDFVCWRNMGASEKDEYFVGLTKEGEKMLSRMGVKAKLSSSSSSTKH